MSLSPVCWGIISLFIVSVIILALALCKSAGKVSQWEEEQAHRSFHQGPTDSE